MLLRKCIKLPSSAIRAGISSLSDVLLSAEEMELRKGFVAAVRSSTDIFDRQTKFAHRDRASRIMDEVRTSAEP